MSFTSLTRNLFIVLFLFSSPLFAGQFDNPYQGNIAVEAQNETELKELALKQVLVKVSGNAHIAELNESKLLLQNIQSLLSQYGYQTILNKRYFVAVFDKQKINQALNEMQQPVWGETRPATLIWLIADDESGRRLISDNMVSRDADSQIALTFQELEHNRGIRLPFPLMDLDDNLALSISDVAGRFYEPITKASKRYGMDHFIVANLKQGSDQKWNLSWELVKSSAGKLSTVLAANKSSGEQGALMTTMVNNIADYYASQYAILENQGEKFSQTIYIKGIHSLAQLTQLNEVLTNLLAVASFSVTEVQDSQVAVSIKINGGLNSFKNGLFAQSHLQRDLSQGENFHFYWR